MSKSALHEFGRGLAYKLFQQQMHAQLFGAVNDRTAASLAAAKREVEALSARQRELESANSRLEAENARLRLEGNGLKDTLLSLRAEASQAQERAEALADVLEALIASLRTYGLDRRKFRRGITSIAERTPSSGPQASRHPVLLTAARKVLGPG